MRTQDHWKLFLRRLVYWYLLVWPVFALTVVAVVDRYCLTSRTADIMHTARGILEESVSSMIATLNSVSLEDLANRMPSEYKSSSNLNSVDIYIADASQTAITKPRYADVGQLISSNSITRAFALSDGEVDSWVSPADYRGYPVVSAYGTVVIDNQRLAVVCEVSQHELLSDNFQWWFFSDLLAMLVFTFIAGIATISIRGDIFRVGSPTLEKAIDNYGMAIRMIREFPDRALGVALINRDCLITDCSKAFAELLGGISSREVIGSPLDKFLADHEQLDTFLKSATLDIPEQELCFVGINGVPCKLCASVVLINSTTPDNCIYLMTLRV